MPCNSFGFKRMLRSKLGFTLFAVMTLSCHAPAFAQKVESTLRSGYFDDHLMVAADHDAKQLTGYYDDGKCRLYFQGALEPVELSQRSDFGEAYTPDTTTPTGKDGAFTTEIYSAAKGGYQRQMTLEPRTDMKPEACRPRISLDRSSNVSTSYVSVRVVRRKSARLYQLQHSRSGARLVRDRHTIPPRAFTGIWVTKSYSDHSPQGYVLASWYDEKGEAHGSYIRERDLYPGIP